MNLSGIIVGAAVFLSIGICHPAVIKMEYHWGKRSWWVFLVAGLVCSCASLLVQDQIVSTILGGFAFSCFWGIHEMFLQEKRVLKGWFPEKPERHAYYEKKRKGLLLVLVLLLPAIPSAAQDKKIIQGFDGGMMVHSGYLKGAVSPDKIPCEGAPIGIGGVIRLHLGNHFRVGGEGSVSTLGQRGNGSYIKYGWVGLLADFYTVLGRFQPYAGITVGGGAGTTLLMAEPPARDWAPIDGTLYHKQGFMALDPFIGCDFIVSGPMHLTLKADWLNCLGKNVSLPAGPRIYIGFLFYH